MNTPIVMAAFGTTTRALETYKFMDAVFRERFPEADIRWAYSSRMVRDWIKVRRDIDLRHPHEVLNDLIGEGHGWAVVQSLHMMCGHEFSRLIEEVRGGEIRTSVGLPLLAAPGDYERVANILCNGNERTDDEALVLVGHGTDHPSWSSYMAMNQIFAETVGPGVHVGMVEGDYLSPESVIEKVRAEGFKKVRLAPMMLVAGVHFEEDITGDEDSWQAVLEKAGFSVSVTRKGMGMSQDIVGIFCDHVRAALDVIPDQEELFKS